MDLDVRRLRVLREVALRGGVTAAAAALHVSPSAVSQQLLQLAREAGCELVERSGRGVVLTPAGQLLAVHAGRILGSVEQAVAGLAAMRREVGGTVRVGSFPSAAGTVVAPAASRAIAAHPGLDVRIVEMEDEPSQLDLRSGTLDVAILQEFDHVPRPLPNGLDRHDIAADPMCLITPASWDRSTDTLADLAGVVWVASSEHTMCGRSTLHACRLAGFEPDIRHRANDFVLTLELVAAGLGAALAPAMALWHVPDGVVVRPLREPVTQRRIFAVTRRGGDGALRPAVVAVLAELTTPPTIRRLDECIPRMALPARDGRS